MQCLVDKEAQFECDTIFNVQPVQLLVHYCVNVMLPTTGTGHEASCSVLNLLQNISDDLRRASQQTVAVVQSTADEGMNQC